MSRADIHRFFAVTPFLFWPVLMWNLYWLQRYLEGEARTQVFLVRILTDGRGRLGLEWIARPERPRPFALPHNHVPIQEASSLDLSSRMMDGAQAGSAFALARAVRGATLGVLIGAAGFSPSPDPEPD